MDLLERVRPRLAPRMVVMLSGGRDSVCLLDCAVRAGSEVVALHVDYGLRPEAAGDEALCQELCAAMGVELVVERAGPPPAAGNLHAWAREVRYGAAFALGDVVAAGHTASDQVETVLYRLAASPGRRALLGMGEERVLRPLLACTREETAAHCRARALPWREDTSNDDPRFARARVRHGLLEALRAVHPAAEANVLRTVAQLRDEAEVLDRVVAEALTDDVAALRALPPALRRLVCGRLGVPAERVDDVLGLEGGTKALDLGGGRRAVVEYGRLRVEEAAPPPAPPCAPVTLPVPGRAAWGEGEVVAELDPQGPLDAAALGPRLVVRPWHAGDRMRPAGLGGTKTLQDLFTDRKVPRAQRARVPVAVAGGEIAWVAGVATGERFAATDRTATAVRLAWIGFGS